MVNDYLTQWDVFQSLVIFIKMYHHSFSQHKNFLCLVDALIMCQLKQAALLM